jgi:hypothetical protein
MRLLKHTAVVIVLASAFSSSARAELGLAGGANDPLAPVTTATASLSSTVESTLSNATSTTGDVVDATQSTVTQSTASEALTAPGSTLDEVANATTQAVEQTVAEALTLAEGTVGDAVQTLSTTAGSSPLTVSGSVSPREPDLSLPARTAWTAGTASSASETPQEDEVPVSDVSSGAVEPLLVPIVQGALPTGTPSLQDAFVQEPRGRRTLRTARHDGAAALSRSRGRTEAEGTRPAAPNAPRFPAPLDPVSPLGALLQALGGSSALVTAALLALIGLCTQRRLGERLRLAAEDARSPDVFFRLERPG